MITKDIKMEFGLENYATTFLKSGKLYKKQYTGNTRANE
jgi:hypothetical protein